MNARSIDTRLRTAGKGDMTSGEVRVRGPGRAQSRAGWYLAAALLLSGCRDEAPAAPLKSLAPAPLPRTGDVGGEAGDAIAIAPMGEPVPAGVRRIVLEDGRFGSEAPERAAEGVQRGEVVLLVPDTSTYLVQVAPLLARLDDAGAEVWLAQPGGRFAHRLTLRDEPAFQTWLDQPIPGRLRVIHRADGFELSTSIGKLPGPDSNGPSVPLRGGVQDLGRLRAGLEALRLRFKSPEEICWLPSFGMELAGVAEALSATHAADGAPLFTQRCLVYPRPKQTPRSER